MAEVAPVEFASARAGRIAYQSFGSGAHTIVAVPPLAQNIEVAWDCPEIRAMLERFAGFCRYVHFDKRGTGASDRSMPVPGIDAYVDDLAAVMDAAGIERAHLFAQSEGGPMTLLFAATYPHRVDSVILMGSSARMVGDIGDEERRQLVAHHELFASLWGTPDSFAVDLFAPSRAADAAFRAWHVRYERLAASAESIRELLAQTRDMDVRGAVPEIRAPVLVLRRRGDAVTSLQFAREVAEQAPDGRFVELGGDDHFAYLGDVDEWMDEVEQFVTGAVNTTPVASPPSRIRIETLGRFAVVTDDGDVPTSAWGSRRARTLLKRLAAARGWPVTRDELFDLLWPDESDPSKLGARLSVLLSGVRKILGGGVIADRQTVALDLDHVVIDVNDLLTARDDATVVAAYAGEFLPEDRYEDWTESIRSEARARFIGAARRRWEQVRDLGLSIEAVEIARRLVDVDPYDEDAHRNLVASLNDLGDRLGAEQAREAWVARMLEIGVEAEPLHD